MSSDDDDKTGHGRPPRHTRWKEGQSGNPERRYPKRKYSTAELITKYLLKPVQITVGETSRKMTTLEAILYQLWIKEFAGEPRALKIRLKLEAFARQFSKQQVEVVFIDNDYTTAFAAIPLKKDEDDE